MPVLAAMFETFAPVVDFHVIGQTKEGNETLTREFSPPFSLMDDSALKVSYGADIETVPTSATASAASIVAMRICPTGLPCLRRLRLASSRGATYLTPIACEMP